MRIIGIFLCEFLDEQDMARLSDLKKFLDSQNPIRVKEAVTSNSKYYYFDSCIIRVSDHLDSKLQRNPNYLNIVSANNGDFVISVGGKTFSVNYDEAKKLMIGYISFSFIGRMECSELKLTHTYKDEYFELLKKFDEVSATLESVSNEYVKLKNKQIDEINSLNKVIKELTKNYGGISEHFRRKSECLEIKTNEVKNLTTKLRDCNSALVAAEQANKRSSAKADKIAEEIARLEKENEELRDKLKLINNKVSDLISEL